MSRRVIAALVSLSWSVALAQSQSQSASAAAPQSGMNPALASTVLQVEQTAQQTNLDLAKLRIEKWKTSGDNKKQTQADADSLMNNLSAALPGMLSGVRTSPDALAPVLKLYRDVNVLYDVLGGVTESAGAFGPEEDYNALAADEHGFDQSRRALGDYVENLAAIKDAQIARMAAQPAAGQAKSAVPKKIVDDEEPVKKPHKKKKPAPATAPAAATPNQQH